MAGRWVCYVLMRPQATGTHLLFGISKVPQVLDLALQLGLAVTDSASQLSLLALLAGHFGCQGLLPPF